MQTTYKAVVTLCGEQVARLVAVEGCSTVRIDGPVQRYPGTLKWADLKCWLLVHRLYRQNAFAIVLITN